MATISPLQVCLVRVRVGESFYPRPCVVISAEDSVLRVVAISSKMDLFRHGEHFLIRDDDPDFPATGLTCTSYVLGAPIFRAGADRVLAVKGALTGSLLKRFLDWIG